MDLPMRSVSAGLSPPKGSSKSSNSGSVATALATSRRLRSPWERVEAFSRYISEMPANSRASIALASTLLTHSPLFMARGLRHETMTLAIMGRRRKGLMFWKVQAMPKFMISQVLTPTMFWPLKRMLPEPSFRIPLISRTRVLLPAPFGPMRPIISFRFMEKLTLLMARSPPKSLIRPFSSKKGWVISDFLCLFPQLPAGDFSHVCLGQLSPEFDDPGDLVMRQVLPAEFH